MKLSDVLSQLEKGEGVFAAKERYSFPYRGMLAGYIGAEIRKHGDLPIEEALARTAPKLSNASRIACRAVLGISSRAPKGQSPEARKKLMEAARKAMERLTQEERIAVTMMVTGGAAK